MPNPKTTKTAKSAAKRSSATDRLPAVVPEAPWRFRPYQQDAIDAFHSGRRRQILIWHRRAGKDIFGMSLARDESQKRIGGYVHFYPKHVQAKRAIWNGVDPRIGRKFIDAAFGGMIKSANNTDMFIDLKSGSTWQLLGSDNYDRVVGSNMVGAVFSEWALCDPMALEYIKPIIVENGGWIVLITTYRGRNHAYQMAQALRNNPEWYVDVRTVEDTRDVDGKRIITDEDIARERAEGVSESIIQQEYFCNPAASVPGAVYAVATERLIADASRLTAVWNPLLPVVACWTFHQAPVSCGVVFVQPGESPRILGGELFPFMTIADAVAKSREHRYKATEHLIREDESGVLDTLDSLRIYPEVIRAEQLIPGKVEPLTQAFIECATASALGNDDLFDSLSAYSRRSLTDDERRPYYSSQYEATWHAQLCRALELGAIHNSASGGAWQRPQSYRNADRRII